MADCTASRPGRLTSELSRLVVLAVLAFIASLFAAATVHNNAQALIIATATVGAWVGLAAYALSRGLAKLGDGHATPGASSSEHHIFCGVLVLSAAASGLANTTDPSEASAIVVAAATAGAWIGYSGFAIARGLAKLGTGLRAAKNYGK